MINQKYQERNGIFMSKEKIRKIHLIYGCVTALLIVIVAVGLIISCINIYHSGDRPFSRDVISAALAQLAIPGWLCLISVIGAAFLHVFLPLETEKTKGIRCDMDTLRRYESGYAELSGEEQTKITHEHKLRHLYKVITAVVVILLAVYPVIYYADVSHFGVADINGDILNAVLVVLIPAAAALLLVYLCIHLVQRSIQREIAVYKAHPVKPEKVSHANRYNPRVTTAVRCVLILAAVVLIIMGIVNDGVADVLGKAIRICTECIGLG